MYNNQALKMTFLAFALLSLSVNFAKLEDSIAPKRCPAYEVLVECPTTCPPDSCLSLVALFKCTTPQPPEDCKPACRCMSGYLRNAQDVCIPTSECSFTAQDDGCNGDPNAVPAEPGCGDPCPPTCQNGGKRPRVCSDICTHEACVCKEGFIIDRNTNKCVLPDDCSNAE